jgi:hypothetical protein
MLDLTSSTAEMARQIVEKLSVKLSPVTRPHQPSTTCDEKVSKEYPPLFSEWGTHVRSIRSSLEDIEDIIRRTEL